MVFEVWQSEDGKTFACSLMPVDGKGYKILFAPDRNTPLSLLDWNVSRCVPGWVHKEFGHFMISADYRTMDAMPYIASPMKQLQVQFGLQYEVYTREDGGQTRYWANAWSNGLSYLLFKNDQTNGNWVGYIKAASEAVTMKTRDKKLQRGYQRYQTAKTFSQVIKL